MTQLMDLAPELREQIWQAALEKEAEGRVVLYDHTFDNHGPRIIPRKQLVSTVMGICRETRRFAREFYSVHLEVYKMRPVDMTLPTGPGCSRLGLNVLATVRNLVYAQAYPASWGPDGLGTTYWSSEGAIQTHDQASVCWRRNRFPNADRWLHCWVRNSRETARFGWFFELFWEFIGLFRDLGHHGSVENLDIREWRPSAIWEDGEDHMCSDAIIDSERRVELCDRVHSLINGDEAQRSKYRTLTKRYPTRLGQAQCGYCYRLNNAPHQSMGGPVEADDAEEDDPEFYDEKAEQFRARVAQDVDGQYMEHLRAHYLPEDRTSFDYEALIEGEFDTFYPVVSGTPDLFGRIAPPRWKNTLAGLEWDAYQWQGFDDAIRQASTPIA
ncbi:hypothetical protein PG984_005350 [Apiospora sp. TS-2023a]